MWGFASNGVLEKRDFPDNLSWLGIPDDALSDDQVKSTSAGTLIVRQDSKRTMMR